MKLPRIDYPIHEVKLLSQKEPVKFRPFLVKEQKLMMMAVETDEIATTISTVKQIINNCLIDEIDVDFLPLVDIEILFLNLRARSMGEVTQVYFKCKNKIDTMKKFGLESVDLEKDGEECGMVIEVPVNLLTVPIVNQDRRQADHVLGQGGFDHEASGIFDC